MTRREAMTALHDLAAELRTHLPYPDARHAALVLDWIAQDILRDLLERP